MAQIRPEDLAEVPGGTVDENAALVVDDGTGVYKATPTQVAEAGVPGVMGVSGGSDLVGFLQAGTGATARTLQAKGRDTVNSSDFGAVADDATDNTAIMQLAVNATKATGKEIVNQQGALFDLSALTSLYPFVSIQYRANDDTSAGYQATDTASGEQMSFLACSSYNASTNPDGAAVNEWRRQAPFHPGHVVEALSRFSGADAGLAPGQSRTEPARMSYNLVQDRSDRCRVIHENYGGAFSNFSSSRWHSWRNQVVLTGVGSDNWANDPEIEDRITSPGGGVGYVRAITTTTLTLELFHGEFAIGETLTNTSDATTSGATVSAVAYTITPNTNLWLDNWEGKTSAGDALPGAAQEAFTVWGHAQLAPTYGSSSNKPRTVTDPVLFAGETPSVGGNRIGFGYFVSGSPEFRRWTFTDKTGAAIGKAVAVNLLTRLDGGDMTTVPGNSVNTASVTVFATGQYKVFYTTNPVRATAPLSARADIGGTGSNTWTATVLDTAADHVLVETRDGGVATNLPSPLWLTVEVKGAEV